jgi:hypothetical protein
VIRAIRGFLFSAARTGQDASMRVGP